MFHSYNLMDNTPVDTWNRYKHDEVNARVICVWEQNINNAAVNMLILQLYRNCPRYIIL